jgi:hypothetical protein
MSDENIPLKILKSMNNVEKQDMGGIYKKEIVKRTVLEVVDDNVDIDSLIDDMIELLISISKKQIKLVFNKSRCI